MNAERASQQGLKGQLDLAVQEAEDCKAGCQNMESVLSDMQQ